MSFLLRRLKTHNFRINELVKTKGVPLEKIAEDILCHLVKHDQRPKKSYFFIPCNTKFFKVMM